MDTSENRLYIINKDGEGEAYYLTLNSDLTRIKSHLLHAELWAPCCDVTDFGVAAINGDIYVIGGNDKKTGKCSKKVTRYEPATGKWIECCPLFLSRSKMATSVYKGLIYVSGGEKTDGSCTATCEIYDPVSDTWTKAGTLRGSRANHVTTLVRNDLYCSGGRQGDEIRNNLWIYEGTKWEELDKHCPQKLPLPIRDHVTAAVEGKLYIMGGVQNIAQDDDDVQLATSGRTVTFSADVPTLQTSTSELQLFSPWNLILPDMIRPRHNAGVAVLGERIYLFGGSTIEDGEVVTVSEYFDTKEKRWYNDYRFKKGKLGNVCCAIVTVTSHPEVPNSPVGHKWILW